MRPACRRSEPPGKATAPTSHAMKLYAGTTEQFRADVRILRIAEKLRAEYTTQIGHRPAPSEVASWQHSLMALSMLVDQAELTVHGVILECQLGNTTAGSTRCSPATPHECGERGRRPARAVERRHHRSVDRGRVQVGNDE